jgi:hypothetical protein
MAIIKSRRLTWATMALAQEGSALSHRGASSHSSSWLPAAMVRTPPPIHDCENVDITQSSNARPIYNRHACWSANA